MIRRILFAVFLTTLTTGLIQSRSWAQAAPPAAEVAPPAPAPTALPPPPPVPPNVVVQTPPPVPQGQWVYTPQYGWVWMPYADSFTWVSPSDNPFMYLYSPVLGWGWVEAPWLLGFGPPLYFGVGGYVSFGWYGHPHHYKHSASPPRGFHVNEPRGRFDNRGSGHGGSGHGGH